GNPIITPSDHSTFYCPMRDSVVHWESMATFNPAAAVKNGKVHLLYRAEDLTGEMKIGGHTSRLGMAISNDGLHFKRRDSPVFYPDDDAQKEYEWPGGTEDPRIVETDDGRFIMTYTQWNRDTPRLAVATSGDLKNWEKHGPAFEEAYQGKYHDMHTKSGAILSRREGDRLVATKKEGKYWMYWGVPKIYLATSDDLINWTPVENNEGELQAALSPREGYFDSWLVEAGPPAVITEDGILVIYNAGNDGENGDPAIPDSVYTGGQALFDLDQPGELVERLDKPFIQPEKDYEKSGQYKSGTTFLEGLVHFKDRWFIYYGTADSRVGVVSWDPSHQ
ncbi:glycoside hydrolase family 130 protein, partial [Fodinibius sp.]|uniref:glycoside hydrolase family 130 protein n=1 Tax=Fodinibius sp. TaxID=1872440 RepID=UPI00356B167D